MHIVLQVSIDVHGFSDVSINHVKRLKIWQLPLKPPGLSSCSLSKLTGGGIPPSQTRPNIRLLVIFHHIPIISLLFIWLRPNFSG